jgi:hypothetical protein
VEEFRTLGWRSNFKYCIIIDAITCVINSQSLQQNIKLDQQDKNNTCQIIKLWFRMLKKTSSFSHDLEMKTIWLGVKGQIIN